MEIPNYGLSQRPPIIGLEDYPGGNAKWYKSQGVPNWIIPDYLCVVSEWAKGEELKGLPAGFNPDNIFITGQPSFDRLAKEDRSQTRHEIREKLGIKDDETFITYMGTVSAGDPIGETAGTLKVVVAALEMVAPGNYHFKEKRVNTTGLTTDQIGIASDAVISNGSTTGIDAVYRGIPSVNVFVSPNMYFSHPPESHQEVLQKYPMPMVEDGASPLAINQKELTDILKNLFYNPNYRSILKQKMAGWKVDGHATDRVAEIVLRIANKHFMERLKSS